MSQLVDLTEESKQKSCIEVNLSEISPQKLNNTESKGNYKSDQEEKSLSKTIRTSSEEICHILT